MNRKQKKNKQRIAREHTKKQSKINETPYEQSVWDYSQDDFYQFVDDDFGASKPYWIWCLLILIMLGVLLWLIV